MTVELRGCRQKGPPIYENCHHCADLAALAARRGLQEGRRATLETEQSLHSCKQSSLAADLPYADRLNRTHRSARCAGWRLFVHKNHSFLAITKGPVTLSPTLILQILGKGRLSLRYLKNHTSTLACPSAFCGTDERIDIIVRPLFSCPLRLCDQAFSESSAGSPLSRHIVALIPHCHSLQAYEHPLSTSLISVLSSYVLPQRQNSRHELTVQICNLRVCCDASSRNA